MQTVYIYKRMSAISEASTWISPLALAPKASKSMHNGIMQTTKYVYSNYSFSVWGNNPYEAVD